MLNLQNLIHINICSTSQLSFEVVCLFLYGLDVPMANGPWNINYSD